MGQEQLEVVTFSGTIKKKFPLVEVYYQDGNGHKQNLMCYVYDVFTRHITVKGMPHYIIINAPNKSPLFNKISDPASRDIDHGHQSQGIGIILCSTSINRLRTKTNILHIPELDILLEPTIFGVTISGAVPTCFKQNIEVVMANHIAPILLRDESDKQLFTTENTLQEDLNFLWGQESLGILPNEIHSEDKIATDIFLDTVQRDSTTGKFTVRLPWNNKKYMLTENLQVAAARTRRQQEIMIKDRPYGEAMCAAKAELESGDYIEMVDTTSQNNNVKYYLPFRGVRKDSNTTACRMVMDASSKASASDISLNQALYQGPNLILDLAFCLLRFMLGAFGVIADIEKAFLRILIAECDRDALRFFCYEDPYNRRSKLITYRYKAVMFGSVSSPFLLAAVLQKLIKDDCENIIVREALERSIYVDNVVYAANSEDTILQFFRDSRTLLNKGNFNLRQWSSNSRTLMEQAKSSGVAEEGLIVRVLGLYWNLDTDRYLYNTNIEWDKKFTKRSALRFTNKVFDPLGLLIPISMRRRIFMQKLWTKNLKWDESFEFVEDFKDQWLHLVKEAHTSVTSTFPRNAQMTPTSEVHIFSDASKDSYGTVVYLRSPAQDLHGSKLTPEEQHRGHVHLSCAKGKVAPIDGKQTIPKLELSGVLLAAHKIPYLKKHGLYHRTPNSLFGAMQRWCSVGWPNTTSRRSMFTTG
ncbi:unnamed protein product [Meganyctiphanes norvegica]|uniref:Reverse transcriptase domain-containing protein n=1 Tax=Meganyctiphanes norvegica TaxID=48144 RepID=A0AAV2S8A4_MEGNR